MLSNYHTVKWNSNPAYHDFLDKEMRKSLEKARMNYMNCTTYQELNQLARSLEVVEKYGGLMCGSQVYPSIEKRAERITDWTFSKRIPEQLLSISNTTGNPFNNFSGAKKVVGLTSWGGKIYGS